jgi:hypothetical protein
VKSSWTGRTTLLIVAALTVQAVPAVAQQRADTNVVEARRSMVTRTELQAALAEIQRGLASTGYSQSLRASKTAEADAIRDRLSPEGGDLRSGDEIDIHIVGGEGLSKVYTVTPARTIVLPGNFEIPVKGVLRSEIQAYLTEKVKKYLVDPSLTATASVRISVFGGVNKPGFINVPANMLLSMMLQDKAGGVTNNVKLEKSQILRDGKVVIDGPEFNDAIYKGRTLDQLNVQAGDEVRVAQKPASGLFWRIVGAASGLGGLIYLLVTITK